MPRAMRVLVFLKQVLLLAAVVYFYTLAFAMIFSVNRHGIDRPFIFLLFGTFFLIAVILEAVLVFWDRLKFLFWVVLGFACFGAIGLFLAPALYGRGVLVYVLLEPLIVLFVGGFAFSVGRVLAPQFVVRHRLTSSQLADALSRLPDWYEARGGIEKVYRFADIDHAFAFTNRVDSFVKETRHRPQVKLDGATVRVHLITPDQGGVTATDITHAKRFDSLA
jgi:pterin-4a-carbinolamine dehydratase